MKLIIHAGLHKSGSTYLQHICNDNAQRLAEQGVYYAPQSGYPAHHDAAWRILIGDPQPLLAMIAQARRQQCHTVLLSSEDLEGALYDDRPICAIENAAQEAKVTAMQWHIVLREPGAAFASLFAQLHHHVYADALSLFYDVMRRGFILIAAPMPDAGTPYWYYSFDHARDLTRLASRVSGTVTAHDFAASGAFPGSSLLEQLNVLNAIGQRPGEEARNARPHRDDIIAGFVQRLGEAVPDNADQGAVLESFLTCLGDGLNQAQTYGAIIGKKYAASHKRALSQFTPRQPLLQAPNTVPSLN